jgi:hypothetical protein
MSTTEIFEQALDPFVECLTPEAARRIVALRAEPADQTRLDELAEKANEGTLAPDEIVGITEIGRATVRLLDLNEEERVIMRARLQAEGRF